MPAPTIEQIRAAKEAVNAAYEAYWLDKPRGHIAAAVEYMGAEIAACESLEAAALLERDRCAVALVAATGERCIVEDAAMAAITTGDLENIVEVTGRHKDFNYQIERDAARAFALAWAVWKECEGK